MGAHRARFDRIQKHLEEQCLIEFDGIKFSAESDLFAAGVLDSFGMVELVTFLESSFQIKFSSEELISSQFATLAGIASSVAAKITEGSHDSRSDDTSLQSLYSA